MGQLSKVVRGGDDGRLLYWCQGCDMLHSVIVGGGAGPRWGFNGNHEKPTFTPSVLTTWTEGEARVEKRCHTFITDGKVNFLDDCSHALRGIHDLPELPDWLKDST